MPFVENQGAKLYWDEQGSGEPLLLIMGLSYPSYMWHRSRPVFANSYRTIALDNRGAETPRHNTLPCNSPPQITVNICVARARLGSNA
jgi:pimeloyl-ACP methyl ester carboxylesterase